MRAITRELAGWGNFPRELCRVFRPERWKDLLTLYGSGQPKSVLSRGLGRSYGDSALNAEGTILHERLNRYLHFDPSSGVLECEAGVSFAEIIRDFLPRGYFVPVTPGTKFVTVGGAIAADVHGKNHHRDGSFAQFVDEMRLVTPRDGLVSCSRQQNSELFWATLGGMGLTGAIVTARIRLVKVPSAQVTVQYQRTRDLEQTLTSFETGDAQFRYSVCWVDCLARGKSLGRSVLMRGNLSTEGTLPRKAYTKRSCKIPCHAPAFLLNPVTIQGFNTAYYHHFREGTKRVDFENYFYPLDSLEHWNRLYGKRGFVQFQVVFPFQTSRAGLVETLEVLSRYRCPSFLAVLKTMGPSSGGWLSFPLAGHTLALDLPNTGLALKKVLGELTAIALRHQGRVYLAKDSFLTPEAFRAMYPEWSRFRDFQVTLDPRGLIRSAQARRLGLWEKG